MAKIKVYNPVKFLDSDFRALNYQVFEYIKREIESYRQELKFQQDKIELVTIHYYFNDLLDFEISISFFKNNRKDASYFRNFNLNDLKYNYQNFIRLRENKKKLKIFSELN